MKFRTVACLAALAAASAAGVASAHHSFAMFDQKNPKSISGTVAEFQWTNPHAFIELDVPNAQGQAERWSVELNSPNNLKRQGWKRTSLAPGDKTTIVIAPLRDGKKGGLFVGLTKADGTVLGDPTMRPGVTTNVQRPGA
jgi:hypothetical protein